MLLLYASDRECKGSESCERYVGNRKLLYADERGFRTEMTILKGAPDVFYLSAYVKLSRNHVREQRGQDVLHHFSSPKHKQGKEPTAVHRTSGNHRHLGT